MASAARLWPPQRCAFFTFNRLGHVAPEAQVGGPIGLVQDGDVITINADTLEIKVDVTDEEMGRRREAWVMPPFKYTRGTMMRYIKSVASAQKGCVTDE